MILEPAFVMIVTHGRFKTWVEGLKIWGVPFSDLSKSGEPAIMKYQIFL